MSVPEEHIITHMHSIFPVGFKILSKYGEVVEVIGRLDKRYYPEKHNNTCLYVVLFPCGYTKYYRGAKLHSRDLQSPYTPTVCSVGFLGEGDYNTSYNKEYYLWRSMLQRCYDPYYLKRFPTYKDCSVDPHWHNFQNFCEDIQKLEGYAEWKADSLLKGKAKWELDKDSKQKNIINKVYSQATCLFLDSFTNIGQAQITGLVYVATRIKDNYTEEFTNQAEFGRKYGLDRGNMAGVLHGTHRRKSTHGWVFKVKEI